MSGERLDSTTAITAMLDAEAGWDRRRWAPWLIGAMMLFDSWDIIIIAYMMPYLSEEWGLDTYSTGWLLSSAAIGQFFGALGIGWLAERFGRKPVLCLAVVAMCLASLVCALSTSAEQLMGLRFLQGLAMGGALPVAASYINEIAPVQTRGRFFSTYQFLMVAGFPVAAWLAAILAEDYGWRLLFVIGALPIVLVPALWLLFPDSPRWLDRTKGFGAAAAAIRRLGGPTEPPGPVADEAVREERVPVSALFRPSLRRVSIVMFFLWFMTSLVNYGLLNWTPTIFVSEFGLSKLQANELAALGSIPIFFVPIVLGATIDRFGRRPFAIGGALLATVCLTVLALVPYTEPMALVALTLGGGFMIGVVAVLLWPYSSEVFPTAVRSVGLGVSSSLARAASSLTPLFVAGLIGLSGDVRLVFIVFAVIAAANTLLWWKGTVETARRPTREHV
jgi:putative MFS transporter